ncbi:Heparinase II/III-like protein [Cohaesibacter sp. ES.047]|uniref:heparinase II/III domain-containing protein n=1 Tax=Cohaesibacter sp. ES.047 TaxID=1798205 RepID=UPI000BB8FD5A|nr:heparinase II/III family protein [Cohaesibacter sp. ES.047]SNY90223.1 Heparinase II/III-like protein [Cohaesibacter sp. ES.047]
MFSECLKALPETFQAFNPAWPLSGAESIRDLPLPYRQKLAQRAQDCLDDWPVLTASQYMDFTRNGNRARFEAGYMQRRRMICAFAMADLASGTDDYLDHIIDGALLLCEESGWQLPAHNTYVRDTACLPLPDPNRPVVDLFAAETGALLALLLALLGEKFRSVSPQINGRITAELNKRIITPYLTEHFWWMGNGDEPMCNWTAWCTQNVLLTAFLLPLDQQTRRTIVEKAAYSLDCFLKDYGQDGACEEGILYYRHAGLCLFNALNVLCQVAPDCFTPLWQEEKIRNIAEFAMHMHVSDDRYFNFADSSAKAGYCGAREYLFGKAVASGALASFALQNWQQDPEPDLPEEINLFYRFQTACALVSLNDFMAEKTDKLAIPDHFYPSIGLLTARDNRFVLAVKAGDNGDSHNHNDVGSFILYKNDQPFLIDLGVESYTAKTFSARRYEIWTMQSGYHNLPSFDGVEQQDGERFAARDVTVDFSRDHAKIVMELAGAYPEEAGLKQYRRDVHFAKGGPITIIDHHRGTKAATLSLMLASEPEVTDRQVTIPGLGTIAIEGADRAVLETLAIDDPWLRAAWPATLYRLLLPLNSATLRLTIE